MTDYKEIVELADAHGDEAVILLTQYTKRDILWARLMESLALNGAVYPEKQNSEIERTRISLCRDVPFTSPYPPNQIVIKGMTV